MDNSMDKVEDIVAMLRAPMTMSMYVSMTDLARAALSQRASAANHIEAQQALIEEMREAYTAYEAALANREHGGVAAHKCVDRIGFALSQKDQIDG